MIQWVEPQSAGSDIDLVAEVERIFSPTGLLSQSRNFEFRPQQQQMAVAVARALEESSHLIVEAGTGTGKSLAYLIPSILYAVHRGRKAIISTHTINLQEQLIGKDLPILEQILPVPFDFTMLKGRQNYLCTRRLAKAMQNASQLFTTPETEELKRIYEWSKTTEDGTLSDFAVEPDPRVWAQVCSERGLCSPKLCGHASELGQNSRVCFFQQARTRLLTADVLVVNHTLFFTLLGSMSEESDGGVLFKNDFVVFDEAHTVEHVASRHVGLSVSSHQFRFALQRLHNPNTGKGLLSLLRRAQGAGLVEELLKQSSEFFANIETTCDELAERRQTSAPPSAGPGTPARAWTVLRIRQPDLVADNVTLSIQRLREEIAEAIRVTDDNDTGLELLECNQRLAELRDGIATFLGQAQDHHVYWIERTGKTQRTITLNAAPIDVAQFLKTRLFASESSIIMTSATLATQAEDRRPNAPASATPPHAENAPAGNPRSARGTGQARPLEYFARRVGGEKVPSLQAGSPFDYAKQMRVYVVRKMPDPRDARYRHELCRWIEHFVRLTHGKAFVLFTNARLMREVAEQMDGVFRELGLACLVQGTGTPRTLLLEKFKEDVNSVLFGTDSFWQGVDVPGEALSNVIITRLPFAVPDHPLIEARIEDIEARGGNSFAEFSLPEAILKFRQGVGRLIRTKTDSGIVVVLDNRVLTARYGQAFLQSIPACPLEII